MGCNTSQTLVYMGYQEGRDFEVFDSGTEETIAWYSADPEPTPAEIDAARPGCTRDSYLRQIEAQVPNYSASETLVDKGKEGDIVRASAAATDKALELQETADEDLDAFDPTLQVATPTDPVGNARWSITITELEPWAGAPDNNLGFYSELDVQGEYEDQGADARLQVIAGPDAGAVLPFVQDATDPKLWKLESRDGAKWQDPNTTSSYQLLWGAGSLKVSPVLVLSEKFERRAAMVRYGVANPASRRI